MEIRLQLSWELGIAGVRYGHLRLAAFGGAFSTPKAAAAIDTGFKLELWGEEVRGRRSLALETPAIG